jgi:hypothetical protein
VAALAGRAVGDDRQRAAGDQELPESIAVVGRIGSAEPGRGKGLDQGRCDRAVMPMAGAQREGERPALAVDDGMDLGRPAAT